MLFFVCNLNQSTFFCLFLVPLVSRPSPARLSVTGAILTLRDNLNNSTFRIGLLYPCYTLAATLEHIRKDGIHNKCTPPLALLRLSKNLRDSRHSRSMTLRFALRFPQKYKISGVPTYPLCRHSQHGGGKIKHLIYSDLHRISHSFRSVRFLFPQWLA